MSPINSAILNQPIPPSDLWKGTAQMLAAAVAGTIGSVGSVLNAARTSTDFEVDGVQNRPRYKISRTAVVDIVNAMTKNMDAQSAELYSGMPLIQRMSVAAHFLKFMAGSCKQ